MRAIRCDAPEADAGPNTGSRAPWIVPPHGPLLAPPASALRYYPRMWPKRPSLVALLAAVVLSSCAPERAFTPRLTSDPIELPTPAASAPLSGGRSELSAEE